ncbi:MAG TPA: bifunctional phosphopantothenoylcysteine decarboxylase/phosphopantothenate--cysteine ligase CoaBC [Ignavibacteria bacterium]
MLKGKKILLGITGGIAAYKICNLVRLFVKAGAEVKVIMTPSAAKFVSPLTLSVLSKNEVVINMFPAGDNLEQAESVIAKTWHISYGLWADIFVIAPATANTIAKIVCGISDNFLLSTVLASRCPLIVAPTMDEDMYRNKVTQSNLKKIKELNYDIIDPIEGELASGLFGYGKMAEPETIFEFVRNKLIKKKDLSGKKILITAGPTVEPVDSVRFISNYSSGKMGFEIARAAAERGADVTLITGPVNLDTPGSVKRIDVSSTSEMFNAVRMNMKNKDIIIMSAAVADFKPVKVFDKKVKKEKTGKTFNLELTRTQDILKYLGENKRNIFLIGFALETDEGIQNAKDKLISKNLDMIVLNNPKEKGAGFGTDTNIITLIDKKSVKKLPLLSKYEAGNAILDYYIKNKS